jgi:hypothetical protein
VREAVEPSGCPKCGKGIEVVGYDSLLHDRRGVVQRAWCNRCGAEWSEIWRFDRVQIHKKGRSSDA